MTVNRPATSSLGACAYHLAQGKTVPADTLLDGTSLCADCIKQEAEEREREGTDRAQREADVRERLGNFHQRRDRWRH